MRVRAPLGSSPRMRGTQSHSRHNRRHTGIIPAYAGNTCSPAHPPVSPRDHPRVCGEHFNAVRNATSPQGSSPRMRGTRHGRHGGRLQLGIIPAYAGNTIRLRSYRLLLGDHPRVCGEHRFGRIAYLVHVGSSPRMRGTRVVLKYWMTHFGIIPAYAGNTQASSNDLT